MALIDEIERLGAACEAGMPKDQAVQLLVEYSDGGLTRRGAQEIITRWRDMRAEYERAIELGLRYGDSNRDRITSSTSVPLAEPTISR